MMVWVVVRQKKEQPHKLQVVHNGTTDGKQFIGENAEQRAHAHAKILNRQHRKYTYFAVELV